MNRMKAISKEALFEDDDINTLTVGGEVLSCTLENKLEVGEVDKIHELFQRIKEKSMPLSSIANQRN